MFKLKPWYKVVPPAETCPSSDRSGALIRDIRKRRTTAQRGS